MTIPPTADSTSEPTLAPRLWRGALWVVVGRGLGIVTTLLVAAALPRFLAPDAYAAFALVSSVMIFAGGLAMFGLNGAMVRFLAERRGAGDLSGAAHVLRVGFKVLIVSVAVVAGGTGLYLVVGGLRWFGLSVDLIVVALVCAGLALLALQQVAAESLRGFHELRFASLISGGQFGGPITNLLFLGAMIAMAWSTAGGQLTLRTALALFVIALLVTVPIALVSLRRTARGVLGERGAAITATNSDRALTRTMLSVCTPLMVLCGLSFAVTQADLWIAGATCAPGDVALYSAARRLVVMVAMPLQMVNLTVMSSIPELHIQGRTAELQRVLRLAALVSAVPAGICLAVMLIRPAVVLSMFAGSDFYREGAPTLAILCLGQVALVMAGSCALTLSMTGHHRVALKISVASAILLAIAGPLAARSFGLRGLALAAVAATVSECTLQWWMTHRLLGIWTHCAPWDLMRLIRLRVHPEPRELLDVRGITDSPVAEPSSPQASQLVTP